MSRVGTGGGGGGGGQKSKVSLQTLGLIHLRNVLYWRVVALQLAYCTYLFEDSVAKIRKFEYFRPRQLNVPLFMLYATSLHVIRYPCSWFRT